MAFDDSTRARLREFVSAARTLLTAECTRQLQHEYGMDPETGQAVELAKLPPLDDTRWETAQILRDTLAHYLATSPSGGKTEALQRIVREQAFTILNRLVALRMMEARGLLLESIARGYQSRGFQLYQRLAGAALGETGDAYRCYLQSLFDEFSLDLAVLFDRFSSQGRLFPRESALLELLGLINHPEIESLWAEDETIGWIYQYYNSQEERRQMRIDSPSPRNSRELAVRNQFFTPRYVVEFLTDNTLGRLWYEMTQGCTALMDQCRYLIRRPQETFLQPEEALPAQAEQQNELSQEELLQQAVYIPFHPLKDPREIRMLDPACGSMHFGLYAFDLFETIYTEAWEIAHGSDEGRKASASFAPFVSYEAQYPDKAAFFADVPRLIIKHNLHGIDIDPRAVQIAGLSLWLRAQRTWQQQGLRPQDRPRIRRSNIVCAEPMPGEEAFLNEFIEAYLSTTPEHKLLGQLALRVFDAMKLAGEAGSLLKIEEEIAGAVAEARQKWLAGPPPEQGRLFPDDITPPPQKEHSLDVAGITDETFWERAEERIYAALRTYAEQAEHGGYQRRLFADDAARGFAFIDLCRKQYDVVLMNPPFGQFSKRWKDQAKEAYPYSYNDILGAFTDAFLHRLHFRGRLGAITSRTCFFLSSFTDWRNMVVFADSAVSVVADLGQGVMDNAMVEAAAYVMERARPVALIPFIRALTAQERESLLSTSVEAFNRGVSKPTLFLARQDTFKKLSGSPFVYWINDDDLHCFSNLEQFEPYMGLVRQGLSTSDNPRFVRTTWEVAAEDIIFLYYPANGDNFCRFDDPVVQAYLARRQRGTPRWAFHVLSGISQPWYAPITVIVNFRHSGAELANFRDAAGRQKGVLRNASFYHRAGFSWTRRAARFYPYLIPGNCIASASRYMAFPNRGQEYEALAVSASRVASAFMRFYAEFWQRPNFLVENLKMLPVPELDEDTKQLLRDHIVAEVERRRRAYQNHEPFHEFLLPAKVQDFSDAGRSLTFDATNLLGDEGERRVERAYGFNTDAAARVERDLLEALAFQRGHSTNSESAEDEDEEDNEDFLLDYSEKAQADAVMSYALGTAFGRWDIQFATGEKPAPELPDPFAPLPVCPPGQLQNQEGLPITREDVTRLKEGGSWHYPLEIPWDGILVDDPGHPLDLEARVHQVLQVIWRDRWEAIEREACESLGVRILRDYLHKPTGFFAEHLKRYSKSRRKAPIYWPLQTPSGSYTLWLYYHRLNDQTLYTCVNDFVEKSKLRDVTAQLNTLRMKTSRSKEEEKELDRLLDFEQELKDFRDELLRVAKFWKPNLNDGVQITAAPLWKLFQYKPWQKTLKDTWEKLEKGDYDWAHLAYSIWPDRVRAKCRHDKSLAIAHGLEDLYEEPVQQPRKKRGRTRV